MGVLLQLVHRLQGKGLSPTALAPAPYTPNGTRARALEKPTTTAGGACLRCAVCGWRMPMTCCVRVAHAYDVLRVVWPLHRGADAGLPRQIGLPDAPWQMRAFLGVANRSEQLSNIPEYVQPLL